MDFSIAGCGFKAEIDYLTFGLRRCRPGHFDSAECAKKKPKQKKKKKSLGKGVNILFAILVTPRFYLFSYVASTVCQLRRQHQMAQKTRRK